MKTEGIKKIKNIVNTNGKKDFRQQEINGTPIFEYSFIVICSLF